ncbi:MAG TPA: zf-HC2 domain-containing protein [Gemmataceae bacterium]|jgi:hypothetical protein|nr:zf-HC2 domain-containing protein [Gemmataceae bacterium]
MMGFWKRPDYRTFPELLAAYADGELPPAACARVEAWLAANPAARERLETQIRLSRHNRVLWRAAAARSPSEENWARLFGQLQDILDAPTPAAVAPAKRRLPWKIMIPSFATAAAAVLALYVARPGVGPLQGPGPGRMTTGESFAVATAADVDIISLDDRDVGTIVVGVPPLSGTVVLAAVGDVELKRAEKGDNGMMPKVRMNDAGLAPMIIAPIAGR